MNNPHALLSPLGGLKLPSVSREDPLGLVQRQREYIVPAGCVVFWHPRLLHGQVRLRHQPRRPHLNHTFASR